MKAVTVALAALALAACSTAGEPRIVTKEVTVPIAVKCADDAGPTPAFADTREALEAAKDIFARVKLLLAGRAQRDARIAELTAANAGCR